ncbi:FAD-dependent monooxygenase [Marinicellulosiphila megalodicopiae]|uniref:FAD-dependent monooxygenase n=1 Tax=Marinicellulosiphila megalodicopiae TaxID=2724896 RepID=UPI003BB076D6
MHFDVIICGAGLIGLSMANALDQAGLKCAIVEQRIIESNLPDTYSNRVSALTELSQKWLEHTKAWESIQPYACAYQSMYVYDGEGTQHVEFSASDLPCEHLGHIVENDRMIDALIQNMGNLERFEHTKVLSISDLSTDNLRTIELDNGQFLTTELIIGADSKHSTIRNLAKLPTKTWSYNQTAIVSTVKVKTPEQFSDQPNKTCWQNFTYCGPLAFLPLHDQTEHSNEESFYSIVWSVDDEQLESFGQKSLIDQLRLHAPKQLGEILEVCDQAQFPLNALACQSYIQAGIAIIGDAAHSIHPLAGQGANLGFADAKALFETIVSAKENELNLGHPTLLKRFERNRKLPNQIMQGAMEGFKRGFKGQNPMQVLIRNEAMALTNHPLFPKDWILKHAMARD